MSGGMCSLLPSVLRVTVPVGRHTTFVIEPFAKLMRSHASGGSWSALWGKAVMMTCKADFFFYQCYLHTK